MRVKNSKDIIHLLKRGMEHDIVLKGCNQTGYGIIFVSNNAQKRLQENIIIYFKNNTKLSMVAQAHIPALGRLRQENLRVQIILSYVSILSLENKIKILKLKISG